jgi:hypothetical protein
VRVTVDGQFLVDHLDGAPLRVDPGAHVFTFEVAGRSPVTERLLVREGEVGRHESIVIAGAASAPLPMAGSQPTSRGSPPAAGASIAAGEGSGVSSRTGLPVQKIIGLALGGVGVAGAAVGSAFGLMSGSAWRSAKNACGGDTTACTNVPGGLSYRSTAERDATISTVGFIAGGVLVATGAALFLTAGHEKHPATGWTVSPTVEPRQVALVLAGPFQ